MDETFEDLKGGTTEVTRIGDKVFRSRRQGSQNVERLLTILESRGYAHSPRFQGLFSDGRQVLGFVEGDAGTYPLSEDLRSDEALASAARALRSLHDSTSDIAADFTSGWMLNAVQPYEVICHGDFAPYNTIFEGRRLVSIIDFDTAHPGPRIRDVAYAIYRFAPLTAPESVVGFGSPAEQARRARLFCDHYGDVDRSRVVNVLCDRLLDLVAYMRSEAATGDEAFQAHLDAGHDKAYLRDVEYLRDNGTAFTQVLIAGEAPEGRVETSPWT